MATEEKNLAAYMVSRGLQEDQLILEIGGSLDLHSVDKMWSEAKAFFHKSHPTILMVDAENVTYCDVAGISFLVWLNRIQEEIGGTCIIEGLSSDYQRMLKSFSPRLCKKEDKEKWTVRFTEDIGGGFVKCFKGLNHQISYIGELVVKFAYCLFHPKEIRLKEFFNIVETSGPNAFGIVSLVGLLFGLILAFQAAIPMRMFGAEIYVADLVALSLLRVLGPFIAAVLYCARTGSAFAAEIATMKVNEEIDALKTLGLDTTIFLAIPRVLAGTLLVPLLTLCVIFFGLIGTGIVMISLGFAPVTYLHELIGAVSMSDFTSGYIKSFIFGFIVSAVGCYCGLTAGSGSRAVGNAATSAVVSGIVLVVIAEGLMSVVYFFLGI